MPQQHPNRIAILLNDVFADWETGFLSASARVFFGAEVFHYSPRGAIVESSGGLRVMPDGAFGDVDPKRLAALIVCGSDNWLGPNATDISALLKSTVEANVAVGAICAGTVAAARAGLLDDRAHTSNSLDWLKENAPSYRGSSRYRDANEAVTDRGVVTAPASAPASFCSAVLKLLYPEHQNLEQAQKMMANAR